MLSARQIFDDFHQKDNDLCIALLERLLQTYTRDDDAYYYLCKSYLKKADSLPQDKLPEIYDKIFQTASAGSKFNSHAGAECILAQCFESGFGVKRDLLQAALCYRQVKDPIYRIYSRAGIPSLVRQPEVSVEVIMEAVFFAKEENELQLATDWCALAIKRDPHANYLKIEYAELLIRQKKFIEATQALSSVVKNAGMHLAFPIIKSCAEAAHGDESLPLLYADCLRDKSCPEYDPDYALVIYKALATQGNLQAILKINEINKNREKDKIDILPFLNTLVKVNPLGLIAHQKAFEATLSDSWKFHFLLGQYYAKSANSTPGKDKLAREHYQKSISIKPNTDNLFAQIHLETNAGNDAACVNLYLQLIDIADEALLTTTYIDLKDSKRISYFHFIVGYCAFKSKALSDNEAYEHFTKENTARAKCYQGIMLEEGRGVTRNIKKAMACYVAAVKMDSVDVHGSPMALQRLQALTKQPDYAEDALHSLSRCYKFDIHGLRSATYLMELIDLLRAKMQTHEIKSEEIPDALLDIKDMYMEVFKLDLSFLKRKDKNNELSFLITQLNILIDYPARVDELRYDKDLKARLQSLSPDVQQITQHILKYFEWQNEYISFVSKVQQFLKTLSTEINSKKWKKLFLGLFWIPGKIDGAQYAEAQIQASQKYNPVSLLETFRAITKRFREKGAANPASRHPKSRQFYKEWNAISNEMDLDADFVKLYGRFHVRSTIVINKVLEESPKVNIPSHKPIIKIQNQFDFTEINPGPIKATESVAQEPVQEADPYAAMEVAPLYFPVVPKEPLPEPVQTKKTSELRSRSLQPA